MNSVPSPIRIVEASDIPLEAARLLSNHVGRAVARRGYACIALSGGSTPRALFRLLAEPFWQSQIPWELVDVWWVDERCVPPDHLDSNYGAAFQLLFQHLPVVRLHRMRGEDEPHDAAQEYESELRQAFRLSPNGRPRFDLVLLGMGDDGHTASLFPGTPALDEEKALVTVGEAPVAPQQRITLTLPVLNRCGLALFLIAGASKGPALAQIFGPNPANPPLPAGRVHPTQGKLIWLVDSVAAHAAGFVLT
ncbi:MAG: 6-phosphogluconolactonase [Caldilineales bacterium]|nr:6-phosphogluconolactonase [Caldilineales bacterium]